MEMVPITTTFVSSNITNSKVHSIHY